MNIKRYSTFCKHRNQKKKKIIKLKSKYPALNKKVIGFLGLMVVAAAGLSILFNLPFMSLGLEERDVIKSSVSETELEQDMDIVNEISTVSVIEQNKDERPVQKKPSTEEQSATAPAENGQLEGLGAIQKELEQIAVHDERPDEGELTLRYQQPCLEKTENIRRVSGSLNSGETLYQHLVKYDIPPVEILRLQEKIHSVVDIGYLNAGTKFAVHYKEDGSIVQFDYQPNELDVYHIKIPQTEGDIQVSKDKIFREIVCFEGEIKSSLYEAMLEHADSGQLAIQLAEIFAWDIDFLTECQPGDTFKILVEKLYRGDFYRWGDILAAVYEGEMLSTHTAILFEDSSGNADYYDEDGRCLRKAFLRAPLNYKYISSHYTESRLHPILRIHRPHRAIDYAAPTGTPVVSIGAGTVISRYYDQGGYGNYVEIRHTNGYVTGYGHLSKYAQGLHVGQRVEQGEVIGYVGATGLATGPHLDFSISKDGVRFNFLELDMPPADSIRPDYQQDFELVKENYLSILKETL